MTSSRLRDALLVNAVFSGMSGHSALIFEPGLRAMLGPAVPGELVAAVGASLIGFSLFLLFIALSDPIPKPLARAAMALDLAWVVGSIFAVQLDAPRLEISGRRLVLILAVVVAVMAVLQWLGLRHAGPAMARAGSGRHFSADTFRRIGASWLSMKLWVKVWLFFLNGVFLASLLFLGYHPAVKWTLFCYLTAGPFLLSIMIPQRGLSRILGLAHIVPWTPLVGYLGLTLAATASGGSNADSLPGSLLGYLWIVLVSTGICLALDYYDVYRWYRGERFILGSDEAYRAGASGLTTAGHSAPLSA